MLGLASSASIRHTTATVAELRDIPLAPWRNASAAAVHVDNAAGTDAPYCGVEGKLPCATIRYGVSRALPNATVTVQGGGDPYLGECGGAADALSSSSGIRPAAGASLVVQAAGGPVIIDCEHQGRAFRFNASHMGGIAATPPVPGMGAILRLAGLEVRRGTAPTDGGEDGLGGAIWAHGGGKLVLERCAFTDCAASSGGAVFAQDVRFDATRTSFTRCAVVNAALSGGGANVAFSTDIANLEAVSINACNFTDSVGGTGGGGVCIVFHGHVKGGEVSVVDSRFTNTTAMTPPPSTGGGGLFIGYHSTTDAVTTRVLGCTFVHTRTSFYGGGLLVYHQRLALSPTTLLQRCSFVETCADLGTGGAGVEYFGGASGAVTLVSECDFEGTRAGEVLYLNDDDPHEAPFSGDS